MSCAYPRRSKMYFCFYKFRSLSTLWLVPKTETNKFYNDNFYESFKFYDADFLNLELINKIRFRFAEYATFLEIFGEFSIA